MTSFDNAVQDLAAATGISMATIAPIVAPSDTPLVPAEPKSTGRRVQSDAAERGRAAAAKVKTTKATGAKAKPAASKPKAPKVATPTAVKAKKTGPARQHPFQGSGCLVILTVRPGDALSGKVVFQSDSGYIDESMAQAVKAGAVTTDQVKSGAAYVAPVRNLWQRI